VKLFLHIWVISHFTPNRKTPSCKYVSLHSVWTLLPLKILKSLVKLLTASISSVWTISPIYLSQAIASVYLHQYAGKSVNYPKTPTFTPQLLWDSIPVTVWYDPAIFLIAYRFNLIPHQTVRINPDILIFTILFHLPINGSMLFHKAATASGA
jgi:hypothetical protein